MEEKQMEVDIYDNGMPKYSTATSIYEKLSEIYYNEEASILGEMFPDVSYDNQDYYYTDKGTKLKERFDAVSGFGNKMWIIDLAISKLKANERDYPFLHDLHDIVFEAANNEDLAKKIGFKQLFVKYMLFGDTKLYKQYLEEFETELRELNRFGLIENYTAWQAVINCNNFYSSVNDYRNFSDKLHAKILDLPLHEEMVCVAECQTFLSSYDDFIFGLRINQELYNQQQKMYNTRMEYLQKSYTDKVINLIAFAENRGLFIDLDADAKLLEAENAPDNKPLDYNDFRFSGEQIGGSVNE